MQNNDLSQAIAKIKQIQNGKIKVCIWLNDDSIYKSEIYEWFKTREADINTMPLFGIPIMETSEQNIPSGFNPELYDQVFWFVENEIKKIPMIQIQQFIDSNKE